MAVKAMQKLQVKNTQKEYKTYRNILDLTPLSNLIKNITTDIEQEIAKGTKKLAVLKDLALFVFLFIPYNCFKVSSMSV